MHHQARTAVITGASRGLGKALARALAERGWRLIVDARAEAPLRELERDLGETSEIVAIAGDIADERHRHDLVKAAAGSGQIDVVVNNAGTLGATPLPTLLEYPVEQLETVFRTNTIAPVALLQGLRPYLAEDARIINISSDAAVEAYEGWGGYGASKAALEHISAILAAENAGFRVYWVDPGDMRTQMQQDAFPGDDISDRPLPEASVPGLLQLIEGSLPSGRYQARTLGSEVPV